MIAAGDLWCDFLEQLDPFTAEARFQICKSGDIAAWTRQALHKTLFDRLAYHREYNGNCGPCVMQR